MQMKFNIERNIFTANPVLQQKQHPNLRAAQKQRAQGSLQKIFKRPFKDSLKGTPSVL
jgi:hypothetical protein